MRAWLAPEHARLFAARTNDCFTAGFNDVQANKEALSVLASIEGALNDLVQHLGRKVVQEEMQAIYGTVEAFLNDALQISPEIVSARLEAEEFGYL